MVLSIELKMLLWASVLGVLQLVLATASKTLQSGMAWNLSPRDTPKSFTGIAARLDRAFYNFMETFPFFIAAILIVQITTLGNHTSALGAQIYFGARLLYIPLYAFGIPVARTLAWTLSLIGLLMVMSVLIF